MIPARHQSPEKTIHVVLDPFRGSGATAVAPGVLGPFHRHS